MLHPLDYPRAQFTPKDSAGREPTGIPEGRPPMPWLSGGTTYTDHFVPKALALVPVSEPALVGPGFPFVGSTEYRDEFIPKEGYPQVPPLTGGSCAECVLVQLLQQKLIVLQQRLTVLQPIAVRLVHVDPLPTSWAVHACRPSMQGRPAAFAPTPQPRRRVLAQGRAGPLFRAAASACRCAVFCAPDIHYAS